MTRVLVIDAAGNLWGSERALLDFVVAAPQLIVAVCCPPNTPLVGELRSRRIAVLPYYVANLHVRSRWQRARAALGVLRACLGHRPHVIHLNQSGSYKVALVAAALLRIPIVAHVRIFEDASYLARQRPARRRLRALIAISNAVEAELEQFRALAEIPVHRLYDAYVTERRPPATSGTAPKARIACVGRLVPVKGQGLLLRSLAVLKADGTASECLMIGEGQPEFMRHLQELATQLCVETTIQWAGFVQDVGSLLRDCSVLVCPSHREPLGRVILEAWDAGVVPVAFAGSGGAAEVIAAADGGLLYDEQTPESLARALRLALALSPEDAARLVRNGRSWMREHCDPATYGCTMAEILSGARLPLTS